jgi:serine/threonine-protein kinase SRK2
MTSVKLSITTNVQKIVTADYVIPEGVDLSSDGKNLIASIFLVNPNQRINLEQMKTHPWFTKNLPLELQVRLLIP